MKKTIVLLTTLLSLSVFAQAKVFNSDAPIELKPESESRVFRDRPHHQPHRPYPQPMPRRGNTSINYEVFIQRVDFDKYLVKRYIPYVYGYGNELQESANMFIRTSSCNLRDGYGRLIINSGYANLLVGNGDRCTVRLIEHLPYYYSY
jgi:hypothetical protein